MATEKELTSNYILHLIIVIQTSFQNTLVYNDDINNTLHYIFMSNLEYEKKDSEGEPGQVVSLACRNKYIEEYGTRIMSKNHRVPLYGIF